MSHSHRVFLRSVVVVSLTIVLGACAVAPTRNYDPFQKFNRKVFAFNRFADKVAIRPLAKAYVKVTGPPEREHISDFFANLRSPITIINEVLQGRPGPALQSTARLAINSTIGLLGFFDPATGMHLPAHLTDFGVTLARWGVPQGPYLVLPILGPSTVRDVWRYPADYYMDPMGWYASQRSSKWYVRYLPTGIYLVTVRASLLPYDKVLDSAFDPYTFVRDAYLQHRLYMDYFGNPPLSAIEALQGTSPSEQSNSEIEQLLEQQRQYEKTHPTSGPEPSTP